MRSHTDRSAQIEIPGMAEFSGRRERIDSVFDLTSEEVERLKRTKPKTLGIVCGRSECKSDLHCYLPERRGDPCSLGSCQHCGEELVDGDKMRTRWSGVPALAKFDLLKKEWIRHFFFHLPLTPRIEAYACKHGLSGLGDIARKQLNKGTMLQFVASQDFRQTTMLKGTIVHWGRHAVACCCRRCMAYWHNVPLEAELTTSDIDYFGELIMLYVKHRIPDLANEGGQRNRKAAQCQF